jgi:hypothetical protein
VRKRVNEREARRRGRGESTCREGAEVWQVSPGPSGPEGYSKLVPPGPEWAYANGRK